jgi:hypothetical protein
MPWNAAPPSKRVARRRGAAEKRRSRAWGRKNLRPPAGIPRSETRAASSEAAAAAVLHTRASMQTSDLS